MLKMANIELIRKLHFKEGRSIRQLAKDLTLSRQTIRKALQQNEIPTYQRSKPVTNPVIDPVKPIIIRWLTDDETAPPKTASQCCSNPQTLGERIWL
ncbi:hypothetical protein [Heyndrickxia sporothermodurans]|uniref:hypothetical protein n=1 Tax=Heyndrickxia sporothermodurans TaxID=46224 RepID=UPI0036D222AB